MSEIVGCAESSGKRLSELVVQAASPPDKDALRAVFFLNDFQLVPNVSISLIPRGITPFSPAARAHTNLRSGRLFRVFQQPFRRGTFCAKPCSYGTDIGITEDFGNRAVP